jgi:predicted NAD/FAD-binding protein
VRIAIVGSGISGLLAAYRLHRDHDVTLYEAAEYPGGHSHTVDVLADGEHLAIDTGFIVYNERNYPVFTRLLRELGIATQPSEMSFSMRCERTGLEYNGRSLNTLFAQRRNLFSPSFMRMLAGILRLNASGPAMLAAPADQSLGDFLREKGHAGAAVEDYLLPMAGAIWSAEPSRILDFPARHFGRFFTNHGLLGLDDRPQWRTIRGGSREYVRALVRPLEGRLRLRTPVEWVRRSTDQVLVKPSGESARIFDRVVLACHSDEALRLLNDPRPAERAVLSAIPYQVNEAVLHTDERLLPRARLARAAWNYHRDGVSAACTVTYDLTTLQSLGGNRRYLVTLNASEKIDPRAVVQRISYSHPIFTLAGMAAQERWPEINGANGTYFCGAYWGYGFHEDGVRSALAVVAAINGQAFDEKLHLRRVG